MARKNNWKDYETVLKQHNIKCLYHFTDRDNLKAIIENGGLYSWKDCEEKGIKILKPGGGGPGSLSWSLDTKSGLQHYVRVSFTKEHPMMYIAMNEGRITNPVLLEIDPAIIFEEGTLYSDRNATRNGAKIGGDLSDFKRIHFDTVKQRKHFDVDPDEQQFYQAEILVNHFIPLLFIKNIANFGIPIPVQKPVAPVTSTHISEPQKFASSPIVVPTSTSTPTVLKSKIPYTAQITRNTPTAFIFLVDQSASMQRQTTLFGEKMPMSEAVARIVNRTINELVLRCVKANEVRHYYDIAIIGYGENAYSAWEGALEGRGFVSPDEIKNNPFKRIWTREEVRTRKGTTIKEIEKDQWLCARHDGHWTRFDVAFDRAKDLLEDWLKDYHDKDCYPPTIINITDGEFNKVSKDVVLQKANELKSMFTNDGNIILYNIHISPSDASVVFCPASKSEVSGYSETLYELSSLLPMRYNEDISKYRKDIDTSVRHSAMCVNADMSTLIQMMDIGTPTNISQK